MVSLQKLAELAAKTPARAMKNHAHHQMRSAQYFGYFPVAIPLEVAERDHLGRFVAELSYGFAHVISNLGRGLRCFRTGAGAWE
jgi:hypothetical protein